MKVYIVFWNGYDGSETLDKVISDENKARTYINNKNGTTDFDWYFIEMEVE
jgi:hypothetical protein